MLVVDECFCLAGESSPFLYCWSCTITQLCVDDLSLGITACGLDLDNGRRSLVRFVENITTSLVTVLVPLEFDPLGVIFGST